MKRIISIYDTCIVQSSWQSYLNWHSGKFRIERQWIAEKIELLFTPLLPYRKQKHSGMDVYYSGMKFYSLSLFFWMILYSVLVSMNSAYHTDGCLSSFLFDTYYHCFPLRLLFIYFPFSMFSVLKRLLTFYSFILRPLFLYCLEFIFQTHVHNSYYFVASSEHWNGIHILFKHFFSFAICLCNIHERYNINFACCWCSHFGI